MDSAQTKKSNAKKVLSIIGNVLIWMFVIFAVFVTVLAFAATSSADGIPSLGNTVFSWILTDSMEPTFAEGDWVISRKLADTEKTTLQPMDIVSFKFDQNKDGKREEINTHRIIEVIGEGSNVTYVTKGDNESIADLSTLSSVDVITIVNDGWKFTDLSDKEKTELKPGTIVKCEIDGQEYIQLIKVVVKENNVVTSYKTKAINTSNTDETVVKPEQIKAKLNESVQRIPGLGAFLGFLMKPLGFFLVIVLPLAIFFIFELIMFIRKILQMRSSNKKEITAAQEEEIKKKAIEDFLREQQEKLNQEAGGDKKPEAGSEETVKAEVPEESEK